MRPSIAAAAFAALALGAFASTAVRSQDDGAPLRTGFVDVQRAIQEWNKRAQVEKVLQGRQESLEARFKADRARIDEKEQKLATLNESSEEYLHLQREVDGEKLLLKRDREYEGARLARQQRSEFWMLYKAVVNEARAVAEAKGLSCVMSWSPLTPNMDKEDPLGIIPTRAVLWADPRLDLTNDVVQSLNAQTPK